MLVRTDVATGTVKALTEENLLTENSRAVQLLKNRTIFISEAVTSDTARHVVADLLVLDAKEKAPIYLYLNSPGGEVTSGFSIYDTIRFIDSEVTIISAGLCASIATIINIAVPLERRFALPNARFMIHQPAIHGQVVGTATDIQITATEILKTRAKLNKLLAEGCGQPVDKLEKDCLRDYWMCADEATEYGLVSKVILHKSEL